MAISEALDSFYAEAEPSRVARQALPLPVPPYASVPVRRPRMSGSSMMAFAAVCGSLAAAVVIGVMLLSRAEFDSPAVDPSTSITGQVAGPAAVEPQLGPVPGSASNGAAATPPAPQPATPSPSSSGGAVDRPVVPAEPAVDTPRQPPASRQAATPAPRVQPARRRTRIRRRPRNPKCPRRSPRLHVHRRRPPRRRRDRAAVMPRRLRLDLPSQHHLARPWCHRRPVSQPLFPLRQRPEPAASSPATAAAAVTPPPARDPEPASGGHARTPAANNNAVVPARSPAGSVSRSGHYRATAPRRSGQRDCRRGICRKDGLESVSQRVQRSGCRRCQSDLADG